MTAPLYSDLAYGPEGGAAYWLQTEDGLRIRAAVWGQNAAAGTVIVLPGRTEFVEKYGDCAQALLAQGYATVAIDWRGQGLADRPKQDPMIGHVADFEEYQRDLRAVLVLVAKLGLAQPLYLMAHSMGGAIGLRALMAKDTPFRAAVFSAPMWGIAMAAWLRPLAEHVSQAALRIGQGHRLVPSQSTRPYITVASFAGNVLTSDPEMWARMQAQLRQRPELSLAGPSLGWLQAALRECQALAQLPSPAIPALTVLGSLEKVVDLIPIHLRMAHWPQGRLEIFKGAQHEVPMETPPHRHRFYDLTARLYAANR